MSLKTVLSILALTVVGSLSVAACAAPTDETADPEAEPSDSQAEELRLAKFSACKTDGDCVAVATPACCPTGLKSAVNKDKVAAFEKDNACKLHVQACTKLVILETRIAECNAGTKKCEMIKPEDVRCGGFMMSAHRCAAGYSCDHTGINPDLPGKCVQDAAPVSDCRKDGCGAGKYCSACWGKFACIPNGAMC
ncbi:hypothetical protein BH11MYX4_BH11MYX4_55300 [soil metagenome]